MVAEHVTQLLAVAPWIDQVWGYPRFPKGPKPWQDLGRIRKLRAAKFDAVINLNGSDRSSLLTLISGARWRLGRRPQDSGPWYWPVHFTHTVSQPHATTPVYQQRWQCLLNSGIPVTDTPQFNVAISPTGRRGAGITSEQDGAYIHLSPFTTQDQKELPESTLISFISALLDGPLGKRLVISCAPNQREKSKLSRILSHIPTQPWRVYDGTLNLMDLVSVIAGARVHFGGDSGALHLALMTGIPTVSWFRKYDGMTDWAPSGPQHMVLVDHAAGIDGLTGIKTGLLLSAAFKAIDTAGAYSKPCEDASPAQQPVPSE